MITHKEYTQLKNSLQHKIADVIVHTNCNFSMDFFPLLSEARRLL